MLKIVEALKIIEREKRVAVVGLSPKTDRPSYRVGKFLQDRGYKIIPVNPFYKEILGEKSVSKLSDLTPGSVGWVDMFVNPNRLMEFTDEIIELKPVLVWCQIGVVSVEFEREVEAAGIKVVMDRCPAIDLRT